MKKRIQPGTLPKNLRIKRLGSASRRRVDAPQARSLIDKLRHYQSELKIQNQALRFSQMAAEAASERFASLFSNVPLALMVIDESAQVLQNNARALTLFRPLESDPPLNFLLPLVLSELATRVLQGIEQACQYGISEINELTFCGGSNGLFTGDLHIARLDDAQDNPVSLICAVIDQSQLLAQRRALQDNATTLKDRNEALRQSQTRLAAIIDSSLDAIVGVDKNLCISVFNPAAQILFDYPGTDALGRALADFLPQAAVILAQGGIAHHARWGEMSGITRNGTSVPLNVSVSQQNHPDADVMTLFAHDLTASKKLEAHRATLEAQLRDSQKMQAIGTMAGGIAHDFNNIIGAILGNVALARQDADIEGVMAVSLNEIDRAGRRARDLVRQILTFSRHEPPRRSAVQLADVIRDTVQLFKVTLPPHIGLQIHGNTTQQLVMADATQIEQALLNLCTNAMYAIGQRPGQIRIALDTCSDAAGQQVKLSVCDTGSGISSDTLKRIFEPFFTTKPVGQGTGLGLSVVHGIMQTHMGRVEVHSTEGVGSEFCLIFPVCHEAPITLTLVAAPVVNKPTQGAGQRVMYVDDDEALIFLVQRALRRKGYQVTTFSDPKAALSALQKDAFAFDLLVTDFNMPGYSGVELIRDALNIRADLPVALASGYVSPDIERDALQAGAMALIHKPNDIDELCATVQTLLHKTV